MVKKRKLKIGKQAQSEIAEEATEQQQRLKLKYQIRTLKRLPKDFRDITLGTDWEAFAKITGRRKEMDDWYHGPILYLTPLNESERSILGSPNKLIHMPNLAPSGNVPLLLDGSNWISVFQLAEATDCSWIYLPDEGARVVEALNVLFSRFGMNIRAKGQLISEHTGKPVGVVH